MSELPHVTWLFDCFRFDTSGGNKQQSGNVTNFLSSI